MLGTIVNALAVLLGGAAGLALRGIAPTRLRDTVMKGLGLAVLLIGLKDAIGGANMMCTIISIAVGCALGEAINIERRLAVLGDFTKKKIGSAHIRGLSADDDKFTEGFVTASLLFCTGAMAIVGSLEGGLMGSHDTLFAKSLLDAIAALFFASTLGVGVLFSAVSVFVYQGLIVVLARFVSPILTDEIVREMSAVGGLLIVAIGINLMQIGKLPVGNMIISTFVPILYIPLTALFS
ncbi:MAG: DUF554 domain-containing protein [Oscillospiraceae bacterium]|nr:DUF554 domain-containing protein [Oscillospiraceae bacterium]